MILKSDPVVRSSRKKVHSLKEHKGGGDLSLSTKKSEYFGFLSTEFFC